MIIFSNPDSYRDRKNDGEFGFVYRDYNFRRIINILGDEGMKKWVMEKIFTILRSLHTIQAN